MKLPFGWLPGHWGLKGKTREIAKAEYELDGYERDCEIVRINHDREDTNEMHAALRKVARKHNKIDEYTFQLEDINDKYQGIDRELKKLELDWNFAKIDDNEYMKMSSTVKGEPYIAVVNSSYDPKLKLDGFEFEFDWNHIWIEELIAAGYTGHSEEMIVQQWFEAICRSVVLEAAEDQPLPFNSRRTSNRRSDDGNSSYHS